MRISSILVIFLCLKFSQVFSQKQKIALRFSSGISLSEPDLRGKDIVPNLRLGQTFEDIILEANASIFDSYFWSFELSYFYKERFELYGQLGNTVFYDDFPMVVNNGHFSRPGQWVTQELQLVNEYFNYTLSPNIGFNVRIVEYNDMLILVGTSLMNNTTYYKQMNRRLAGRGSPPRLRKKFFFDRHSIEAYAAAGIGYKKLRFFVDYRYFFIEYLDDATYNDGVAIKYENLTKFRFRMSYDLEWEKK